MARLRKCPDTMPAEWFCELASVGTLKATIHRMLHRFDFVLRKDTRYVGAEAVAAISQTDR